RASLGISGCGVGASLLFPALTPAVTLSGWSPTPQTLDKTDITTLMGMNDIKNTNRTNRDLLCPRAHLGDRALVQRGMPHRVLAIAVRHLRARGGGHSPPSPRRTPRRAPTGRALVAPTHKIDPLLCLSSGRTRLGKRSLRVVFQDRFAPFDPGFDGCLLPARPIQVVGRIAPGSTPTPPADHIRGHGNGVT